MAKSRAEKELLLEQYKAMLTETSGFIAVNTKGIDSVILTDLKMKLKQEGTNLSIVKNNVFKIALTETDQPLESSDFVEQTAVIAYNEDPTVIAKLIKDVQEDSEGFDARYGIIDGKYLDSERVMQLAEIPPKEVLLAQLLGSINAPLGGFVNAISGNVRQFVRVLSQLDGIKEESATKSDSKKESAE